MYHSRRAREENHMKSLGRKVVVRSKDKARKEEASMLLLSTLADYKGIDVYVESVLDRVLENRRKVGR